MIDIALLGLPRSAMTDLAFVMARQKPAARLWVGSARTEMRRWARRNGLFTCADADGYVVVSHSGTTARRILNIDRRPGRHTIALGRMLGYPTCCSRAAAAVGDEGIDRLSVSMSSRRFHGAFKLIDPSGYQSGSALLSHVPCSRTCAASLSLARRHSSC